MCVCLFLLCMDKCILSQNIMSIVRQKLSEDIKNNVKRTCEPFLALFTIMVWMNDMQGEISTA